MLFGYSCPSPVLSSLESGASSCLRCRSHLGFLGDLKLTYMKSKCLAEAISNSPCSPTNATCICSDKTLDREVTLCVTKSCTIKEALSMRHQDNSTCSSKVNRVSSYQECNDDELWRASSQQSCWLRTHIEYPWDHIRHLCCRATRLQILGKPGNRSG